MAVKKTGKKADAKAKPLTTADVPKKGDEEVSSYRLDHGESLPESESSLNPDRAK